MALINEEAKVASKEQTVLELSRAIEDILCKIHDSLDSKFNMGADTTKQDRPAFAAPNVLDIIIHNLNEHGKHLQDLHEYIMSKIICKLD